MKFYRDLYLTENLKKKKRRVMWKLAAGSGMADVYVITLSSNGTDMLDVVNSAITLQPVVRRSLPLVVGMASGYDGALALVEAIVKDVRRKTGTCDVRGFFEEADKFSLRVTGWQKE